MNICTNRQEGEKYYYPSDFKICVIPIAYFILRSVICEKNRNTWLILTRKFLKRKQTVLRNLTLEYSSAIKHKMIITNTITTVTTLQMTCRIQRVKLTATSVQESCTYDVELQKCVGCENPRKKNIVEH